MKHHCIYVSQQSLSTECYFDMYQWYFFCAFGFILFTVLSLTSCFQADFGNQFNCQSTVNNCILRFLPCNVFVPSWDVLFINAFCLLIALNSHINTFNMLCEHFPFCFVFTPCARTQSGVKNLILFSVVCCLLSVQ